MVMKRLLAAAALLACSTFAGAADKIKIGFLSTLSGPSAALGVDIRDGFNLAIKHQGGKLGGLPVDMIVGDDAFSLDTARQITDRMPARQRGHHDRHRLLEHHAGRGAGDFPGPDVLYQPERGAGGARRRALQPFFFNVAWQNDNLHEAMGKHVADKGYKNVYLVAPNYSGGRDALNGFKRFYKGTTSGEVYTKLGQLDYAAELAQLRRRSPTPCSSFFPAAWASTSSQHDQAGLSGSVPLFGPGFSADEDVIRAVGDGMQGMFNSSHWGRDR